MYRSIGHFAQSAGNSDVTVTSSLDAGRVPCPPPAQLSPAALATIPSPRRVPEFPQTSAAPAMEVPSSPRAHPVSMAQHSVRVLPPQQDIPSSPAKEVTAPKQQFGPRVPSTPRVIRFMGSTPAFNGQKPSKYNEGKPVIVLQPRKVIVSDRNETRVELRSSIFFCF